MPNEEALAAAAAATGPSAAAAGPHAAWLRPRKVRILAIQGTCMLYDAVHDWVPYGNASAGAPRAGSGQARSGTGTSGAAQPGTSVQSPLSSSSGGTPGSTDLNQHDRVSSSHTSTSTGTASNSGGAAGRTFGACAFPIKLQGAVAGVATIHVFSLPPPLHDTHAAGPSGATAGADVSHSQPAAEGPFVASAPVALMPYAETAELCNLYDRMVDEQLAMLYDEDAIVEEGGAAGLPAAMAPGRGVATTPTSTGASAVISMAAARRRAAWLRVFDGCWVPFLHDLELCLARHPARSQLQLQAHEPAPPPPPPANNANHWQPGPDAPQAPVPPPPPPPVPTDAVVSPFAAVAADSAAAAAAAQVSGGAAGEGVPPPLPTSPPSPPPAPRRQPPPAATQPPDALAAPSPVLLGHGANVPYDVWRTTIVNVAGFLRDQAMPCVLLHVLRAQGCLVRQTATGASPPPPLARLEAAAEAAAAAVAVAGTRSPGAAAGAARGRAVEPWTDEELDSISAELEDYVQWLCDIAEGAHAAWEAGVQGEVAAVPPGEAAAVVPAAAPAPDEPAAHAPAAAVTAPGAGVGGMAVEPPARAVVVQAPEVEPAGASGNVLPAAATQGAAEGAQVEEPWRGVAQPARARAGAAEPGGLYVPGWGSSGGAVVQAAMRERLAPAGSLSAPLARGVLRVEGAAGEGREEGATAVGVGAGWRLQRPEQWQRLRQGRRDIPLGPLVQPGKSSLAHY